MGKPDQGSAAAEGARRATGDAAGPGRGGRLSVGRKREVVLRLLRGEDLESVSRAVGITAARASQWRDRFLAAGAGQPEEPGAGCPERRRSSAAGQDRRAADGERVTVREGGPAGGGRPFGPAEVEAMRGAHSISTRRAYGLQRICRVWHCARSSVYARRQATTSQVPCRRRGPVGAAPDDVLVGHIRRVLEASPFHGEGYRKAWAKLRVEGIRTSQERVRRLMREHDLQAPHRVGRAHGPKAHDGTITTEVPNVMWGTDMTATMTVGEGAAFVFVAVDHCTTECIGLHAAARGNRFEALEPIRQGVRDRFGDIGDGIARGLRLRHDHGSNYLADDFQQEVAFFGIESSPSFVREPEGNGVAERFIRTLKENLLWVRSFDTIEALRLALLEFKRTYNEQWMLEKYHYRSPAQVRRDLVGLAKAA